ncbi:hypothetical protein M9Y10_039277 [Tritrichomonas musculus]|uniref:Transmembrane protein 230 n=1 Tax=Tritrichomonas musculus TaxID=1915356 RepID=A0ABR2KBI7_9EUKA
MKYNKFDHQSSRSSFFGIKNVFKSIRNWVNAGDPPPKTQVKSLYLIFFLLLLGISSLTFLILSYFEICFIDCVTSLVPVAAIAFLTLTPSLYGVWVSFCCWRRVYGYDWFMIPNCD